MKTNYAIFKLSLKSAAIFLMVVIAFIYPQLASSQVIKPFLQRTSSYSPTKKIYNIKGDFTMIGNTNLMLDPAIADRSSSNSNQMVYVDVDGDPNTLNSSSANLNLSAENGAAPACSNIIYAGLYWTGRSDDGTSPNTFTVSKNVPGVGTLVNQDYTLANSNSVTYTNYALAIARTGSNNNSRIYTYKFTSTGSAGNTVAFIYRNNNSIPTLNVSVNGGAESAVSCSTLDLNNAIFSMPYVVYSETGGVILKVFKLSKNGISSSAGDARAYVNVSGTYSSPVIITKNYDKHVVSFKGPGATAYNTITANSSDIYYPASSEGSMYSAYAEVTDYVKMHGLGDYFVADVAIREGNGGNTGFYGGWGLIVVYENSKMKYRDVTIFDGHAYVAGNISAQHELPVTGFNTVQAGEVNMKLGLMAGEGDLSISGDYFKIQKQQTSDWLTLSHSGNTTANFFNSSVNTGGNARNPNITNNTGLDIAMFNIPNSGNAVITNNQIATKFQYGSTQDTYIIFCIAMAVDAYKPQIEGLISVKEIKRNGMAVPNSGTVLPGDIVTYKVDIKNKGTEMVGNSKFVIPISYTASYIDGSAIRNIYFTSPTPAPNSINFNPTLGANGSVVYNLGALPLDPDPNKVLADMEFSVKVTEDCSILKSCSPDICLNGIISGSGAITGTLFDNSSLITGFQNQSGSCDQEPISAPLCLNINGAAYVDEHCDATPDVREFTYCISESSIPVTQVSGFFPAGSRFYDSYPVTSGSTEYSISNPFPATSGTKNYYAIPPFASDCQFQFSINNTNISSVPSVLPIAYCQDDVAPLLVAIPGNPTYQLYYYTSDSPSEIPQLSITPLTSIPGLTTYFVAEGMSGQCISKNRAAIAVTVNALPLAVITNTTATTVLTCTTPSISVTATGGVSYLWSDGTATVGTAAQLSITTPGTYTVTATSANGCSDTKSVTITEDKSVTAGITNNTATTILTCTTPAVNVTATGGVSYLWSNGSLVIGTAAQLSITAPGTYTV
ncbi:MAG: hypothetical protein WCL21_16960, partial [Mariniphaga sp.]